MMDQALTNKKFIQQMDEVIEALGGTPSEIAIGDDKADDMVSDNIFQLKMEDVVKNISGGGGGGGSAPLIVNIEEEGITWTLDKTWSEIKTALLSGLVYITFENEYTSLFETVIGIDEMKDSGQYGVRTYTYSFFTNSEDGYPDYSSE